MAAASALNTLQQLAGKHVDIAADKLATANKQLRDAEAQLTLLQSYRQDYLDKLARQLATGLDAHAHQNFQRFMRMLDQAIAGQDELLRAAQAHVQHQLEQWRQSQKKKLSYEVLCERSHKQTQLVELKRDQKLMDEHAMRSRKFS